MKKRSQNGGLRGHYIALLSGAIIRARSVSPRDLLQASPNGGVWRNGGPSEAHAPPRYTVGSKIPPSVGCRQYRSCPNYCTTLKGLYSWPVEPHKNHGKSIYRDLGGAICIFLIRKNHQKSRSKWSSTGRLYTPFKRRL